ncbi:putative Ig domain-containing protein [Reichenbachiella versicolor]|uniref:putative Ig domain-containing protein n=1 Tax=Reichenbachiella versicolor TaxID=1821036 RepID=UPI000D6E549D|nr:putative Ig domain-containing protein [Reichenbachiella versicolor]
MNRKITLYSKYVKFKSRLDKAIKNGSFSQYTYRKRQMLLHRLERLKRQIEHAGLGWKLATVSAMSVATMMASSLEADAQKIEPAGTEVQVNTHVTGIQSKAAIASDADGDYVIAWQSYQDGDGYGIYAQRYNASGEKQGVEFKVNQYTTGFQINPSAAMDSDGDFVIVWESSSQDGSSFGVYAQSFDANGVAQKSDDILVNTETSSNQRHPSVGMDSDGDFVVTWQSYLQDGSDYGVYAQRFQLSGDKVGGELSVNTDTDGTQRNPSIAVDSDGDFVIAWEGKDSGGLGVFAQRFSADGSKQGDINKQEISTGDDDYTNPSVAMDSSGDYIIAWNGDYYYSYDDGMGSVSIVSNNRVQLRRYNANGLPKAGRGTTIVQDIKSDIELGAPSAAITDTDKFVITWEQENSASVKDDDIYAAIVESDGTNGRPFVVNTHTTGFQELPVVASDASGGFIIAWQDGSAKDGSGNGVFAQRYETVKPTLSAIEDKKVDVDFTLAFSVRHDNLTDKTPSFNYDLDAVSKGLGMSIDPVSGAFKWTPTESQIGKHPVTISMTGDSESSVTFNIEAVAQSLPRIKPSADEFLVNTKAEESQVNHDLSMDADGDYVVVWESYSVGSANDIYAQRFGKDGARVGTEFIVNKETSGYQQEPAVAMDADGDFAVVWKQTSNILHLQQFDASGKKQGEEIVVSNEGLASSELPSIAKDADGDLVVVWVSSGKEDLSDIHAQRYNSSGEKQGGEFLVNTWTTKAQSRASVSMDADGDFVIAWQSYGQEEDTDIYVQRYNAAGEKQGAETLVNTVTTSSQGGPSVSMYDDGSFVVAWHSTGQTGDHDIYVQRFDQSGNKLGTETLVNSETADVQAIADVTTGSEGFVVTWRSIGQDAGSLNRNTGVFAQRFDFDGNKIGNEFLVNKTTTGSQREPKIASDNSGDFVIAWGGNGDGDNFGVFTRFFDSQSSPELSIVDQSITAGSELTFIATASDIDGDALTYSLDDASKALGMTIEASTGKFSWTPSSSQVGEYNVTVTVSDGTFESTEIFKVKVSELLSVDTDTYAISLFPNPATSTLNITDGISGKASYEIYDLLGNSVLSGNLSGAAISIVDLPTGIYVLKLSGDDLSKTARFIKE